MAALKLIAAAGGAVLLAGAAGAASADDQLISKPNHAQPQSLDGLQGTPWWKQLARCAGFYDSVANGYEQLGQRQPTRAAEAMGDELTAAALARLRADRGLDDEAAVALIAPEISIGRGVGERLWPRRNRVVSSWNIYRSQCLDVRDVYASR